MEVETFRQQLLAYSDQFLQALATDKGDWVIKGFIDVNQRIYTLSVDTKVISKIIELLLIPIVSRFAQVHQYQIIASLHQNHYPDMTLIAEDKSHFALDFKSTYRKSVTRVSGFTLGAFTGYFRQRNTAKNITYPYDSYSGHVVLGSIYTRADDIDEGQQYTLADLDTITSVATDFQLLIHEKWRIASDKPGSGNTKNIGSITNIADLIAGRGTFAKHGYGVFDRYWRNYLTRDMARAIDSIVPYRNLEEYLQWRDQLQE